MNNKSNVNFDVSFVTQSKQMVRREIKNESRRPR